VGRGHRVETGAPPKKGEGKADEGQGKKRCLTLPKKKGERAQSTPHKKTRKKSRKKKGEIDLQKPIDTKKKRKKEVFFWRRDGEGRRLTGPLEKVLLFKKERRR